MFYIYQFQHSFGINLIIIHIFMNMFDTIWNISDSLQVIYMNKGCLSDEFIWHDVYDDIHLNT